MSPRKYLAGITLLFAILGLVLVILGNDIAWMFFIIAGFVGFGTLGGAGAANLEKSGENPLLNDSFSDNGINVKLQNEIFIDFRDHD